MAWWDTAIRIGEGIGTGGLSEGYRAATGKGLIETGAGLAGQGLDSLNRINRAEDLYGGVDPSGRLGAAADQGQRFAGTGAANYAQSGRDLTRQRRDMRGLSDQYGGLAQQYGRIASGQDSISAEQLRQGLQMNQAAQMSAAAGAAPQNQVMAARNAAIQMGRQGMGLAGQQAMAGLQERRDALGGQLGAMGGQSQLQSAIQGGLLTGRGQDVQFGLGGQQNAIQGYGNIEQNRTQRYGQVAGAPTPGEQVLGALQGIAGTAAQYGGAAASDRRAKKDIESGDDDAEELLKGLRAYRYKYRSEKDGKGEFVGPMAQDLEKSRAGRQAVFEGPDGKKMVHGARLSLALAAAAGNIDRRLRSLEKGR
jgi:hypothetical protein